MNYWLPIADSNHGHGDARRKAPTVTDLVEEYVERHAKRFKKSWEKDQRILNREVVPAWGERKAADVVKRDVIRLMETILDRGAPIMANNTLAVIRKMFNWAVEQDILEITPCLGIKPPKMAWLPYSAFYGINVLFAKYIKFAIFLGARDALGRWTAGRGTQCKVLSPKPTWATC